VSEAPAILWVDGEPASVAALAVPALVNYGHFTAMQVRQGAVRGLGIHLRRADTAHRELFGHGLDTGAVRAHWALAARRHPASYLRATFYDTPDGHAHDLVALRPPSDPAAGPLRLRPVSYLRPLAHLKHTGTFPLIYHGLAAERDGYDDALLTTPDGEVAETTTANIGFVTGRQVTWPTAPALLGTGQELLEAALPASGLSTGRARVHLDDLAGFDAAFTVNSVGVVPVAEIGGHRFTGPATAITPVMAVHAALPWDQI
jgi:branched-subunit amino acid aminotransferase/4-amino-4-deoxychorismate lyase